MLKSAKICIFFISLLNSALCKAQDNLAPGTIAITGKVISTQTIATKDTAYPFQCCTKIKILSIDGRGSALLSVLSQGDIIPICTPAPKRNKQSNLKGTSKYYCNKMPKGEAFTATLHEHFLLGNKIEYSLGNYKTIKNKNNEH